MLTRLTWHTSTTMVHRVNVDYNMFLTVNVNYKWGVLSKDNLKVIVKKAAGTPSAK